MKITISENPPVQSKRGAQVGEVWLEGNNDMPFMAVQLGRSMAGVPDIIRSMDLSNSRVLDVNTTQNVARNYQKYRIVEIILEKVD